MIFTRFMLTLLSCACFVLVYGQRKGQPSAKEVEQAEELQEKFEDAKVAALASREIFVFGFDKKDQQVTVTSTKQERLVGLSAGGQLPIVEFYDETSSVENIKVTNRRKRNVPVYPRDEHYQVADYFYSDARIKYFSLDFPQIGQSYTTKIEKVYHDVKYFTRTYFASSVYPIANKELQFVVPRWLDVELHPVNFAGWTIEQETAYDKKADADIHTFKIKDVKPFSEESNAPAPAYLYPHLLVLAKSYNKDGKTQNLFASTQDQYNWYRQLVQQIGNEPEEVKAKVKELCADAASDLDKVKAIFYWVQDNIRYIAFEDGLAGFKPESCQQVFQNKYSDCKGMANLTCEMLRLAGFDARLTWIGTQRIPYDYSTPSLAVDNHMICTVILDDVKYFLDPTEKYIAFGDYAQRIQGQQAMIENGDAFILEEVPVQSKDKNAELIRRQMQLENETLVGKAAHEFNGESRSRLLYHINQVRTNDVEDALKRYITEGDKNLRVSNIATSDLENRDQVLNLSYTFEQDHAVSSFGEETYIELDFYREFGNFTIEEDRELDYQFDRKIELRVEIELTIPEGLAIQELPKGLDEQHPDFSFQIKWREEGGRLFYDKIITIDQGVIPKGQFDTWNRCIKLLQEAYQEQIVLVKKS